MWLLRPLSRLDAAAAEAEKAVELDPLSPYAWVIHTFMAYCRRRYDDAIARTLKTLELDPQYYWAHLLRALSFIGLRAVAEAEASAARLREVLGEVPMAIAIQGLVDAAAGRVDAAREAISRLQSLEPTRYVSPHFLAWLYSSLGDRDTAFEWLDRGYAGRDPWVITIHSDPLLDPLIGDPRMKALAAKLNLQQK
jgi:tetratricopeptide (TPR) repeat protein